MEVACLSGFQLSQIFASRQTAIMLFQFSLLLAACLSSSALASPTKTIVERADLCGQWDSVNTGAYTVYNNQWGIKGATGSQCFGVDSASGSIVKWHTTYETLLWTRPHLRLLTRQSLAGPGRVDQTESRRIPMPWSSIRQTSYPP